jgi:hypothetical protein
LNARRRREVIILIKAASSVTSAAFLNQPVEGSSPPAPTNIIKDII